MDIDSYSHNLTRPRRVRRLLVLEALLERFTPGERFLLYVLTIVLGASALAIVAGVNGAISVNVPAHGGTLVEGEVGPVRFVNPILAMSQADEDLTALVYSGLMRAKADGTYLPDLASSYDISPDGTTYTFHLRKTAVFHDNSPVTAADVVYTISLAQNPEIKSPRRADWDGVAVSAPDEQTVVFKLPRPYAPFLENATIGILPKHVWQNVSPEEFPFSPANVHPVGSGPFRVVKVDTDATGSATRYELAPFSKFALGAPYLKRITFIFFGNDTSMISAFNAGQIDAIAALDPSSIPDLTRTDANMLSVPLPRVFGIFFNQGHAAVLADPAVRAALDAATDKQAIINEALHRQGVVLSGPLPPGLGAPPPATEQPIGTIERATSTQPSESAGAASAANARVILQRGGWKFDDAAGVWKKNKLELRFTLATANEPELVAAANAAIAQWHAAGIEVNVQVYPLSELNTNVIRPRAYDAILFGEVVGRTGDLFAFWHSSQRNDPGLNLSLYANARADALLAEARSTTDGVQRQKLYEQFATLVAKDQPAVFLFAPKFMYVLPAGMRGALLGALTTPAERFQNVYQWYTDTEHVWNIFTNA